MSEEKKSITLNIAQNKLKLTIAASDEELYREAERRIQTKIRQFAEKNNITDSFNLLCYAVVFFALNEVNLTEKQRFVDTELRQTLVKIQEVVDEALKK